LAERALSLNRIRRDLFRRRGSKKVFDTDEHR
jgi:hypothetical protein